MEFWETLQGYLTPETITVCITVISFLVALLKLISVVIDLKKQNNMTMEKLLKVLKSQNEDEYSKEKEDLVKSLIDLIQPLINYSEVMTKVLALSQENTPESRIAILDLIKTLGAIDNNIIDKAKVVIEDEKTAKEEKKQAMVEQLEAIENKPVE